MTLADGPFGPLDDLEPLDERAYRRPTVVEEAALVTLMSVLPLQKWGPPGPERERRVWIRLLAKSHDWNLPPRITADRLFMAITLGLEPDW